MQPLVSVILVNYNYARYLPERIESIFNQEFEDYELIVLDDASNDNSLTLLNELSKNPKVSHFVLNDKNSGSPFAQWKKGVELARGKYIWIAEADDSSTPTFLRTAVEVMEKDPDIALCYTGSIVVDGNGERINRDYTDWKPSRIKSRIGETWIHDGKDFIVHNMYWGCYVYNASATLFRKSCVSMDMFDESALMKNSGDWLFWTKLMAHGKVAEIYMKLNILRRHNSTATDSGLKSGVIYIEDAKVLNYIEKHYDIGLYRKFIRHGTYIKHVLRTQLPDNKKQEILENFYELTGGRYREYLIERIHKVVSNIFPVLISKRTDRL